MKNSTFYWAKILGVATFVIAEAYLVGCGKIDGLPSTTSGNSIPGIPDPPPNPPVGVVDDIAGFYVQHQADTKYTYVSHKDNTTMATKCTAAVGEKIDCYIEGQELDL